MDTRRILIAGLSSHAGGRLAQTLERAPQVQAIVGIDTDDPRHELNRTEFVRVDTEPGLVRRIIAAAAIDTVIEPRDTAAQTRTAAGAGELGTAGLLAACEAADSPVRKVVIRSSAHYYGFEPDSPAFCSEALERARPPRTPLERAVVQTEAAAAEFAARNPAITVTVLRIADAIGDGLRTPHLVLLGLPAVPAMLGFDARWQFIHDDDVIGVLAHAARKDIPGTYNAAADGVLTLSEIVSLLGKPLLPILPPWGTGFTAAQLRRLGLPIPLELVGQLRFGRGLDNRRLKATGYSYRYTTREAVLKLRAQQRLRPLLGAGEDSYRYERDVEEFLRRSPSVRPAGDGEAGPRRPRAAGAQPAPGPGVDWYEELTAGEVIEISSSLDLESLAQLRRYEATHKARAAVLDALDLNLERKRRSGSQI